MQRTSQITKLPAPPSFPSGFTSRTLHSNCILLSFTNGGLIRVAGTGVNPAFSNSLTSRGNSQLASDCCYNISIITMFMATSGTAHTFSKVCFVVLSLTRRAGEKITMGGFEENTLKKLKGLRLTFPS